MAFDVVVVTARGARLGRGTARRGLRRRPRRRPWRAAWSSRRRGPRRRPRRRPARGLVVTAGRGLGRRPLAARGARLGRPAAVALDVVLVTALAARAWSWPPRRGLRVVLVAPVARALVVPPPWPSTSSSSPAWRALEVLGASTLGGAHGPCLPAAPLADPARDLRSLPATARCVDPAPDRPTLSAGRHRRRGRRLRARPRCRSSNLGPRPASEPTRRRKSAPSSSSSRPGRAR